MIRPRALGRQIARSSIHRYFQSRHDWINVSYLCRAIESVRIGWKHTLMTRLLCLLTVGIAFAQEPPAVHPPAGTTPQETEAHQGPSEFEVEFVASDIFRSASYLQPLWRGLGFEGDYFGGKSTDVGLAAGTWTFRFRALKLSPGVGVLFGSNQFATTPAVSFRWDYEHRWFVTQGLVLQGFRRTPVFGEGEGEGHPSEPPVPLRLVRPTISDGNHVSVRWERLTIGGSWEHIHFREGNEWKGGGRLSVRLVPRLSAILYVFGPGRAEWRGGIVIHPPEHD
jgi:hypothetical protein